MSFTYSKNNTIIKALKIDLCGTPHLMLATLEYLIFDIDFKSSVVRGSYLYDSNHAM